MIMWRIRKFWYDHLGWKIHEKRMAREYEKAINAPIPFRWQVELKERRITANALKWKEDHENAEGTQGTA